MQELRTLLRLETEDILNPFDLAPKVGLTLRSLAIWRVGPSPGSRSATASGEGAKTLMSCNVPKCPVLPLAWRERDYYYAPLHLSARGAIV